jgi:hypothetical protein
MRLTYARDLWVLLLLGLGASGQSTTKVDNDYVFNKERYSHKNVSLNYKNHNKINFPRLEKIEVVDARPDSSCIGFRAKGSEKSNQLLQFQFGLKKEFEEYLKRVANFARDSSGYSAVLVVRNYWINEYGVDEDEKDKFTDKRAGRFSAEKTALHATFDFYITNGDKYFVAYRFDTLATAFVSIKDFADAYLSPLLDGSLERLRMINPSENIINKRSFTRTELRNYYDQRWDKPIMKATVFEKGVYKNFAEFANNRPSISQFVVRKDKLADILYVPAENKQLVPARDIWGYSDGKNIFIKSGENYYLLVRVQNSFYFMGSKELIKMQDEYYNYDPYTNMNMRTTSEPYLKNRLFPMRLDVEKGVAY